MFKNKKIKLCSSIKVQEPTDIIQVLKPFNNFSRCFGSSPYTFTKNNNSYDVKTTWIDYLIFAFFNLFIFFLIYMFPDSDTILFTGSEIINMGTHIILLWALVFAIFFNFINFLFKNKTAEILKELYEIDRSMILLNIEMDYKDQFKTVIKYLFCCLSLLTILTVLTGYIFSLLSGKFWFDLTVFLTFLTINLTFVIFASHFILSLRAVQDRFKKLNMEISHVFAKAGEADLSHIVRHMETIHDRLIEIIQKINVRYAFWVLMFFTMVFVFGVLSVYTFLRVIILYDRLIFLACLMRFIWTLFYFLYLLMIIAAGSYTTREVIML